jgi:hypothetical protein
MGHEAWFGCPWRADYRRFRARACPAPSEVYPDSYAPNDSGALALGERAFGAA